MISRDDLCILLLMAIVCSYGTYYVVARYMVQVYQKKYVGPTCFRYFKYYDVEVIKSTPYVHERSLYKSLNVTLISFLFITVLCIAGFARLSLGL